MTQSAEAVVRIERDGDVCIVRLDRPPVNAIDVGLLREADGVLQQLEERTDVGAVVITGNGRSFSAGLDLKAVPRYTPDEQRQTIVTLNRVVTRLYRLPIPTVAAVNGHAIAGGLVLVLACDYRIGPSSACELGLTEARAGIPFPVAPLAVVQAELSPAMVRRLTLIARNIGPEEALRDGILDELQPREQVLVRALAVAHERAAIPRVAYERVKRQFRAEVLARLQPFIDSGTDPLLDAWLSDETRGAASSVLDERR